MNALERLEPIRPEQLRAIQQMSTHVFGGPLVLAQMTGLYTADGHSNLNAGQALEVINTLRKLTTTADLAHTRTNPDEYRHHFTRWIVKTDLQVTKPTEPSDTAVHQPSTRRSGSMSKKRKPGESIAEYGARVFGLDGTGPCPSCGGTGEVDADPDEREVRKLVLGRDNLMGTGMAKVAKLLTNPDLETLRHIAEQADTDLDGAADICVELADMYEAAR